MTAKEIHKVYDTLIGAFSEIVNIQIDAFEKLDLRFNMLKTQSAFELLSKMEFLFTVKMQFQYLKVAYEELNLSRDYTGVVHRDANMRRFETVTKELLDLSNSKLAKFISSDFDYERSEEEEREVIRLAKFLKIPSTLRILDLHWNYIGSKGAKLIADALKVNFTLEILYLSHNGLQDDGAFEIADMLTVNSTLKVLNLDENSIGDKGLRGIASALVLNRALEVLEISNSSMFALAASELRKALKSNSTLKKLNLSNCSISDDICSTLMEGLLHNSALGCLDLSYNQIGNHGAQSIAKVLKFNEYLVDLFLGYNKIRLTGVRDIAKAIRKSESIEKIQLHSNLFDENGIDPILEALQENTSLKHIYLGNFPNHCGDFILAEQFERNSMLRRKLRKFLVCAYSKCVCEKGGFILDQSILRSILFPMM
jgi:Ran GTPase-activating protein (RanGAP) involved in mRNA processing and transport